MRRILCTFTKFTCDGYMKIERNQNIAYKTRYTQNSVTVMLLPTSNTVIIGPNLNIQKLISVQMKLIKQQHLFSCNFVFRVTYM